MENLANVGVEIEIDAKTALTLVAVVYFLFNALTK